MTLEPHMSLHFVGFVGKGLVIDAIYGESLCPQASRCHQGKKECKKFFHIVCLLVNIRL